MKRCFASSFTEDTYSQDTADYVAMTTVFPMTDVSIKFHFSIKASRWYSMKRKYLSWNRN